MKNLSVFQRIKTLFQLEAELDREGTVLSIRSGATFQGLNVWALVIAIFVACIGLNINSIAVVIGAMLISPLMGPISAAGVALGIYDLALLRKALANLALMTTISLVASTLYFWLTPLNQITPELLARTSPTFFDVLIATLGGAALMVGSSQKSKSTNLLAGVAIATALMPPLCTAGYGIANRDISVFAGAIYLYLINSVFIGLVAYLFSKALHLSMSDEGQVLEKGKIRQRHVILTVVAIIAFVTPSFFIAFGVITSANWEAKLEQFQKSNLVFANTQVISVNVIKTGEKKTLEVAVIGAALSEDLKNHLNEQLVRYGLGDMTLKFVQPGNSLPVTNSPQPPQIVDNLVPEVTREVMVLFPALSNLAWGDLAIQSSLDKSVRKNPIAFARWSVEPASIEKDRLASFLRLRLAKPDLDLVHETLQLPESTKK